MKTVRQRNWRVEATFRPQTLAHIGINDLPAKVLGVVGAGGELLSSTVTLVIEPQRLCDTGHMVIPDELLRICPADLQKLYERRCDKIIEELRGVSHFVGGEIVCEEEVICSFCKLSWEETTESDVAKHPQYYDDFKDPMDAVGMPVCCNDAVEEWQAKRAGGVKAMGIDRV